MRISEKDLGKTYRDKFTGYQGIATARSKYLTGCVQIMIDSLYDAAKNEMPAWWIDESRLVLVKKIAKKKIKVKKRKPAGPQNAPVSRIRKA